MASEQTLPRPELSPAKRALIGAMLGGKVRLSGIVPRAHRDGAPLSFAQERLWFVDRLEPGSTTYNMSWPLRLRGTADTGALERALGEIVRRHESLRTVFQEVDGSPVQVVVPFGGFTLAEVGVPHLQRLWLRGGFPRSYLARSERASTEWRQGFIQTFLERDLPQLGVTIPAGTLRRFWTMLAHYHGQVWQASEFARSFGVADTTIRRYLDLLVGTFLIRLLLPWHENLGKRQVKSPKIFFADTGLLHTLLGIRTWRDLETNPKLGTSWEGFLMAQVVDRLQARPEECFFWATHSGAELDLLVVRGQQRRGFEFKRTDAPTVTPSMRTALSDLGLASLDVIHAGERTFSLASQIRAVAATRLLSDINPLR